MYFGTIRVKQIFVTIPEVKIYTIKSYIFRLSKILKSVSIQSFELFWKDYYYSLQHHLWKLLIRKKHEMFVHTQRIVIIFEFIDFMCKEVGKFRLYTKSPYYLRNVLAPLLSPISKLRFALWIRIAYSNARIAAYQVLFVCDITKVVAIFYYPRRMNNTKLYLIRKAGKIARDHHFSSIHSFCTYS